MIVWPLTALSNRATISGSSSTSVMYPHSSFGGGDGGGDGFGDGGGDGFGDGGGDGFGSFGLQSGTAEPHALPSFLRMSTGPAVAHRP